MSLFIDEIYLMEKINLVMPCDIAFLSATFPLSNSLINYKIVFEIIKFYRARKSKCQYLLGNIILW
jgi:hypothetical protein